MGTASSSARVSDQVRRKRREVEEQRTKIVARTRYIEWWKKQGLVTDDKEASPVLSYIVSRLKNLQCPIPEDLFLDAYILDKNLVQTTLLELTTKVFTPPINKEHYENFTEHILPLAIWFEKVTPQIQAKYKPKKMKFLYQCLLEICKVLLDQESKEVSELFRKLKATDDYKDLGILPNMNLFIRQDHLGLHCGVKIDGDGNRCARVLQAWKVNQFYGDPGSTSCGLCGRYMHGDEIVYHCISGANVTKSRKHRSDWDVCTDCAVPYYEDAYWLHGDVNYPLENQCLSLKGAEIAVHPSYDDNLFKNIDPNLEESAGRYVIDGSKLIAAAPLFVASRFCANIGASANRIKAVKTRLEQDISKYPVYCIFDKRHAKCPYGHLCAEITVADNFAAECDWCEADISDPTEVYYHCQKCPAMNKEWDVCMACAEKSNARRRMVRIDKDVASHLDLRESGKQLQDFEIKTTTETLKNAGILEGSKLVAICEPLPKTIFDQLVGIKEPSLKDVRRFLTTEDKKEPEEIFFVLQRCGIQPKGKAGDYAGLELEKKAKAEEKDEKDDDIKIDDKIVETKEDAEAEAEAEEAEEEQDEDAKEIENELMLQGNAHALIDAKSFFDRHFYIASLMIVANKLSEKFQTVIREWVTDFKKEEQFKNMGVDFKPGPVKEMDRCVAKVEMDYSLEEWPTGAHLIDLIRCSVTCETPGEVVAFYNYFLKRMEVFPRLGLSRTKNKFSEKGLDDAEYRDLKINCVFFDDEDPLLSMVCEIQLILKHPFMEFKKNAHKLYSILRQQDFFNDVVSEFRRYTVMFPSSPLEHFTMMSDESNRNSYAIPKSPFAQENVLLGSRVILVGNTPIVNVFVGEAVKQIQKIRTFPVRVIFEKADEPSIIMALKEKREKHAKKLIKPNNLKKRGLGGMTPLHVATIMNSGKLLKRMLKVSPGLINIVDRRNKQSPLMVGIEYGALEAVKILLEHPACNVNLPSKVGVLCTCKNPMKKISGQAMYGQDAECDACGRKISGKEKRYHCTVPDVNEEDDGDEEEEEEEEEEADGNEQGDGQENNEEAAGDGDGDGDENEDGDENGNEEANGDETQADQQGDAEAEDTEDVSDDEEDEDDYDDYDSGDDYESEEVEEKVSKDEHLFDYDMCIKCAQTKFPQGAPPLLLAIRRGDPSIFDALLASGRVDFSLLSDDKRSCIYECVNCEQYDFLAKLLNGYKDKTYPLLNLGDDEKITPAYCAVQNNDVKALELLMKTGVDLNLGKCHMSNEELDPLLLLACRENYEAIVSLLISSKQCDVNDFNKQRPEQTCLFYAVQNQSLSICKLLIANGAKTTGLLSQNEAGELIYCLCYWCECKMAKAKIAELETGEDDEEDDSLDCSFCRKRINTEKNKDGWMYHCTTEKHKYAYYACVSCAQTKSVVQPAFVQKLKEAKII